MGNHMASWTNFRKDLNLRKGMNTMKGKIRFIGILATLVLGVAVWGGVSAQGAQANAVNWRAGTAPFVAAVPMPNKATLSATQNVESATGCPVTAWVGFNQYPTANYTVTFELVAPPGLAPLSGISDTKGEVKRTVP